MSYTIIFCQALGHQLVAGGAGSCTLHEKSINSARVILATYPRSTHRWYECEDGWMAEQVADVLARAAPGELVLVADHDTIERFANDDRLIRAEYSTGEAELARTLERALGGDDSAPSELLSWFWSRSLELPRAGFHSLTGLLCHGGSVASNWTIVRQKKGYKRALDWLAILNPDYRSDPGYAFAQSLVAGDEPVTAEQHLRLRNWLGAVDLPDAERFERFCQRMLKHDAP